MSSHNLYASNSSPSPLSFQDKTTSSQHEHTPTYTRKSTRHISQLEPDTTALWGWFLLFAAYFIFVVSMYAIVVSKFVPETGNKTLDWIKKDEYYCLLIPLTLPVTIYAIFFNWLGMKFFRHN
ncbi:phosphatidylinositol N-acetylglucosaminyltransferase subunit Y-domain-containing protein [Glomus cerebriforme]|uniref:Phosphatidylinositol N-acetylglucosaminyltransferase subunit Y-domain-containing protein n=1 Tax=Glomus cerebriforme TaxID=658196 RepID=A0A397TBE7_9GLOM|nr:phosphatidylinositol N-acetylglucosaminyltransferase subunit Y-domain-containing protein [Glomus cerebriforme]